MKQLIGTAKVAAFMLLVLSLNACGGDESQLEADFEGQLRSGETEITVDSEVEEREFSIVCPYADTSSLDPGVRDALERHRANLTGEEDQYFVISTGDGDFRVESVSLSVVDFCRDESVSGTMFASGQLFEVVQGPSNESGAYIMKASN